MPSVVTCPKCKATLLTGAFNTPELVGCACGARLQLAVFPALLREREVGRAAEAIGNEGEASCFYHPGKKAVITCEGCGRFLCSLCDVELHAQHLCPSCLENGAKKGRLKNLQNERTLYDRQALTLAVVPLFLTACLALYYAIRYWKAPGSVVREGKNRMVLAVVLASLQLLGWVVFIGSVVFFAP